jgi:hypothetical protein
VYGSELRDSLLEWLESSTSTSTSTSTSSTQQQTATTAAATIERL